MSNLSEVTIFLSEQDPVQHQAMVQSISVLRPNWRVVGPEPLPNAPECDCKDFSPAFCVVGLSNSCRRGTGTADDQGGILIAVSDGESDCRKGNAGCATVDFVSRPFNSERLEEALQKAEYQYGSHAPADSDAPQPINTQSSMVRYFKGRDMAMSPLEDVVYFQAQQKYTRVVLKDCEGLLRMNLSVVMQKLNPARFWRAHRSYVVNLAQITACKRDEFSRITLGLRYRPEEIIVSRPYEHLFNKDGFV